MKGMFSYFGSKSTSGDDKINKVAEKSDESSIASPDSVTTSHDEQTAIYKINSCDSRAENASMPIQTDPTAKKRLPSSSPDDQSRIVSKTPKLVLDDKLSELISIGADAAEKTPNWTLLLLTALEASYLEMKKMSAKMDAFASFKEEVSVKMNTMEEKIDKLSFEVDAVKTELSNAKAENETLKNAIVELATQVDRNEQHSRSECLLLHSVPEKKRSAH